MKLLQPSFDIATETVKDLLNVVRMRRRRLLLMVLLLAIGAYRPI